MEYIYYSQELKPLANSVFARGLAERMGFEPMERSSRSHDFQSCALDQLSHLSIILLDRFSIVHGLQGNVNKQSSVANICHVKA
jgi:hypothetical protein